MYQKLISTIKEKNLTIRKVAIMAGITPQSLYSAIKGTCEFWPGWKRRVSAVLSIPEEELFPEEKHHDEG